MTTFNRPGLSQLEYRAGTFATFLAQLKAQLASADFPQLRHLTTRDASDPSIALLDAWATVADVLTFYNERIANEGFLRTATEERSVFELARLIGFSPRPGVAAGVFLAYGLEKDARLTIKKGSRSQSVPGPGELPQTFETSNDLVARAAWSRLAPRLTMPQVLDKSMGLSVKGANLGLKPNDRLLFVKRQSKADGPTEVATRVEIIQSVEASFETGVTKVVLQPPKPEPEPFVPKEMNFAKTVMAVAERLRDDEGQRSAPHDDQVLPPLNSSDVGELLAELDPRVPLDQLNAAARAEAGGPADMEVYVFRVQAAPFGHNAPKRPLLLRTSIDAAGGVDNVASREGSIVGYREWTLGDPELNPTKLADDDKTSIGSEQKNQITLDSAHETILPGSWVLILRPHQPKTVPPERPKPVEVVPLLYKAKAVETVSRANYGVTAKASRVTLVADESVGALGPDDFKDGWLQPEFRESREHNFSEFALRFRPIRETVVYARSERLELAGLSMAAPVGGPEIELDALYDGLEVGRWLIVEGERADLMGKMPTGDEIKRGNDMGAPANVPESGVRTAELVRIALVSNEARQGPGDTFHSVIVFDRPLEHSYKRDTVIVHGNVVAATHGETRKEILGSGDATRPYQTFALRQAPVTFMASPTASGVTSSLEVRVNDLTWHEVDSLADAGESDRVFISELDNKGGVAVTFGGGSRLPTGIENVKAEYRVGIGAAGNARPWQISQLMDRPLGAKEVTNPLAAEGGADRDTADQARAVAPASLKALDRLISVSDYQHFARLFAGIAKATASETWMGGRPGVVVTVAAAGGRPIAGSALHAALVSAMRRLGDPPRSVEVIDFKRQLLVLEAGVRLLPDYAFVFVEPRLRHALLDTFSFDRRRLGEDLPLAQVVAVMQRVAGVHSVDVNVFATVSADDVVSEDALRSMIENLRGDRLPHDRVPHAARPAAADDPRRELGWLVYASPRLPRTLRLKEIL